MRECNCCDNKKCRPTKQMLRLDVPCLITKPPKSGFKFRDMVSNVDFFNITNPALKMLLKWG